MVKSFRMIGVLMAICLLSVTMSSCGECTASNIQQFCPSPYYGADGVEENTIYTEISNRKTMAVSGETLYMTVDEGCYIALFYDIEGAESIEDVEKIKGIDIPDGAEFAVDGNCVNIFRNPYSFYLMKCGENGWEKVGEAPIAQREKAKFYIPLLVNDEERIFAVTDVDEGICVYEFVDGEFVANIFETDTYAQRGTHLAIGAEIREDEGESGTIYMSFVHYTDNIELHLLTYDIEKKEFSEDTIISSTAFWEGWNAEMHEYTGNPQPHIFFPEDKQVEILCLGQLLMDYYLVDMDKEIPELLDSKALAENWEENYWWGANDMSMTDAIRLENGDIHIVTIVTNKNDEFYRNSYGHVFVRKGEVIRQEIFMPSTANFVQLFVGTNGRAYMLMIQNEREILPDSEFDSAFDGDSNGFINGVFYSLSEEGVEEHGLVYIDNIPYVSGGFNLLANDEERTVYICYMGEYSENLITCEISY